MDISNTDAIDSWLDTFNAENTDLGCDFVLVEEIEYENKDVENFLIVLRKIDGVWMFYNYELI